MESKQILEIATKAADSKRAEDIIAMDMEGMSTVTDYFLIMNGGSKRQVQAITDAIIEKMDEAQITIKRVEGRDAGRWVLIDLGDVFVHVFDEDDRSYYNLEKLWSDAPFVDLSEWIEE
ncbi:Iojap family protein [Secundilactobacillus oryzae JCM 18671]|uniref:Ribosomal silencing factor RsfS n=1 Tax=Secundilactobacillus oryzae JCM 18671 TaxID=1291743 RepID=A0A081BG19_9LACO|nr:ribosome silencing factor [Secundilactobacillus oryzae]GAK46987.1 Iojap family protein [Secundilactobacillus oryzae JCM 18671]